MFCHLISKVCLFAWRDKIKINESNVCSRNLNGEKLLLGLAWADEEAEMQKTHKSVQSCSAYDEHAQTHTEP